MVLNGAGLAIFDHLKKQFKEAVHFVVLSDDIFIPEVLLKALYALPRKQGMVICSPSKLKLEDCAHIIAKDARQIHSWPGPRADLVFADPPYSSSLAGKGLHQLVVANAVVEPALIVVETRKTDNCQLGPEFVLVDSRVYGIARLNFFTLARR